jgi:hypothetical protein
MTLHRWTLISVLLLAAGFSSAQEEEGILTYNPIQAERANNERDFPLRERGGGSLDLPFFDDFSRYSLPTNDPDIPIAWQRWEDDAVYINDHFPIEPPTIGVATFDGLKGDGLPYNFFNPDAYGPADTLTSLPIDLGNLTPDDDVYLTFYLQPQGLGNAPDPQDSLVLEFYIPSDGGAWYRDTAWIGSDLTDFQHIFIPLTDIGYFQDGFRFRFRNYASLAGAADQWHLDYVYLNSDINPETLEFIELAIMNPEYTLLQEFSAMPWSHFKDDPQAFMYAGNTEIIERNLNSAPVNFESGFRVEYEDQVWDMPNSFANTNGLGIIETEIESDDFVFDTTVNDTCAVFTVKHYHEITDATRQNDTTSFQQVFYNYYAYDDGSAERAYAINVPGGKVAVKYRTETPDSLIGVFIYWLPFLQNNEDEIFLLRAWGDNGGVPGDELANNFSFQSPNYYPGYNVFAYYEYDQPMYVDGNFYVGWVQDSNANLNVGNDKNTNNNGSKLFYQLGLGSEWEQSSISGSVMIRPVFQSGKQSVWNGIEELADNTFSIFPNPATNQLTVQLNEYVDNWYASVLDASGKVVFSSAASGQTYTLNFESLSSGIYILEINLGDGLLPTRRKFIKQ